jgi:hypothetical protein
MHLQKASRKKAKIKLCLQGPSGSGKTYSALLLAYGLCNDWAKICVIDTENHSADLYSQLGEYNTISLTGPYTPERYMQAIEVCVKAGIEVIIIDSLSHEWEYIINFHASLTGNSFTNWGKVTPRHNEFIQTLLDANKHVIATVRTKQDYVLNERNGKMVPEKIGLKPIQRDDLEYLFTLTFEIDRNHIAQSTKDRTGLFSNKQGQVINEDTGKSILEWCNYGKEETANDINLRINECKSVAELLSLFNKYQHLKETLKPEFEKRKREILVQEIHN